MGRSQCRSKQDCMPYCVCAAHASLNRLSQIVGPSACEAVVHYQQKEFKLKSVDHWKTGQTYKGHPEWDIIIFVVANQQGIDKCVMQQELTHLMNEAAEHQGCRTMKLEDLTTQCPATETLDCELTRGLYEPKHFATTTFKSGQQWTTTRT